MRLSKKSAFVMAGLLALGLSAPAGAANFSFTGSFTQDDDVQLFTFVVGASSNVTLRTWSYAGGTNAAGSLIARGGFDPILALFDGGGVLIDQNDDGGCGLVSADSGTGRCWDTFFSAVLPVGSYTVSVMEYDNFAIGPNLSNGFAHDGDGNFTAGFGNCATNQFIDVSNVPVAECRDSHWAFDILNVEHADETAVPEPATATLLGLGLAGLWSRSRKRT